MANLVELDYFYVGNISGKSKKDRDFAGVTVLGINKEGQGKTTTLFLDSGILPLLVPSLVCGDFVKLRIDFTDLERPQLVDVVSKIADSKLFKKAVN